MPDLNPLFQQIVGEQLSAVAPAWHALPARGVWCHGLVARATEYGDTPRLAQAR